MRIQSILFATVAALSLSACVQNDPYGQNRGIQNNAAARTVGGAVAGAVIADVTGGSRTQGALIGAVAGGASCAIPGTAGCY
ncbi:hypothetical protein [Szabonella alba]|uniref:17 kDa surface antigen n=1 Tax=Szabonella alba TaxID=2804194 RepID=A0A8K0XYE5_9RHOB|nr:hypothetical protein [Szabonella alba]MBL4915975.1 hypothetical protein [Szabonella alba]